jgi:hypothetical protein
MNRLLQAAFREGPEAPQTPGELPILGFSGWTQEQVAAALDDQDLGSLRYPEMLLQALGKFPSFYHGENTRVQAAVGVPLTLHPKPGLPAGPFAELVAHLPELWGGDSALAHALAAATKYRVGLGVAPCYVSWVLSPTGLSYLPRVTSRSAGGLAFDSTTCRYEWQGRSGRHKVVPDGRNWLLFRGLSAQYPHTGALLRPTAAAVWFGQAALRLWWTYAKTHGSGQRKVKVPAQNRQQRDFEDLLTIAREMMGGTVVPCPQYPDGTSFDFELVEAKYSTYETFPGLLDYVQQWVTLCWLGAIDNTQGGAAGSRARAQVHERVSLQYLKADCEVTEAALRVLLRQWCRYNQIDPRLAPVPDLEWEPPANAKEEAEISLTEAQALEKLAAVATVLEEKGHRVDWAHMVAEKRIRLLPAQREAQGAAQDEDPAE